MIALQRKTNQSESDLVNTLVLCLNEQLVQTLGYWNTAMSKTLQFASVILSLLLVSACAPEPEVTEEPVLRSVRIHTVSNTSTADWKEFPGILDAGRKAALSFRVSGYLNQLLVKEGDLVEENQILAQLDDTDYVIQYNRREAEFQRAKADFERARALVGKGAISQSDFDTLKANLAAARSALKAAEQNVTYTSLRAPFSGRIGKRHVDNFEEVNAQAAIFTLQDPSEVTIKVNVPENLVFVSSEEGAYEVYAVFEQLPERQFPLTTKELATEATPGTNTFEITFVMPTIEGFNMFPGMLVTVFGRNLDDSRHQELQVPAHVVLDDGSEQYVYIATPKADGTASISRRPVSVGQLIADKIEITSGLAYGDLVVSAGMSQMYEGLIVKLPADDSL